MQSSTNYYSLIYSHASNCKNIPNNVKYQIQNELYLGRKRGNGVENRYTWASTVSEKKSNYLEKEKPLKQIQ